MALRSLRKEMQRRIASGLRSAVELGANIYQEEVAAKLYPPVSQPGEYPALRTGQGADNVDHEVVFKSLVGGFGVRGEDTGTGPISPHKMPGGMHLAELVIYNERLGPENVFFDNLRLLREEFKLGCTEQVPF